MKRAATFGLNRDEDSSFHTKQNQDKMFRKVLLAEDVDSISIGLANTLNKAFSFQLDQTTLCDRAFLKIRKELQDQKPYDLLITDLNFRNTSSNGSITSGEALLREAKALQPNLNTIIYSIEDRPYRVRECLDELGVNGYVLKGPDSALQMIHAIETVYQGEAYLSPDLSQALQQEPGLDIDDFDLMLLRDLAEGYSQADISRKLSKKGVVPSSLSSIEKRINRLKEYLMARNIPNLIAIAKDMGLI